MQYVILTDGGVYDNVGIDSLLAKRNARDWLIVSDGGKPFALDSRPTESGAIVLKADWTSWWNRYAAWNSTESSIAPWPASVRNRSGSA